MSSRKGFGNTDSYIGYETVIQPNNKIKQGQIHPEIGKIREKFLRKDLKLFKTIEALLTNFGSKI